MAFLSALEIKKYFNTFCNYNEIAEKQKWHAPKLLVDRLLEVSPQISKDLRVVDVGCGTGLSGQFFIENENQIDGIDISCRMLNYAKKKGGYHNLFELDFTNKEERKQIPTKYDLIISTGVIGEFTRIKDSILGFSDLGKDKCRVAFCGGEMLYKSLLIKKILHSEGFIIESHLIKRAYIRYYIPHWYDFYVASRGF